MENNAKRSISSFDKERKTMVARIKQETMFTADYTGRKKLSKRVIQAFKKVPRHHFVETSQQRLAYIDSPLPIQCGQTISQPFIVALMTDLLDPSEEDVVLEIGTGSGYQAAILSELVSQVYTIETHAELARSALNKLTQNGYNNVQVFTGDGYLGLPAYSPYDGIIVTAVAEDVPQPLLDQLKPGGRMVIPVGRQFQRQNLLLITKSEKGEIDQQVVLPVAFVPLTRHKHDETLPVTEIDFPDPDQKEIEEIREDNH